MTDAYGHEATGPTGDNRVDAAVARLKDLDTAPVDDHVRVYQDIHAQLGAALGQTGDPVDPVDPLDPMDPIDPVDPIDKGGPVAAGGPAAPRAEGDLDNPPADQGG